MVPNAPKEYTFHAELSHSQPFILVLRSLMLGKQHRWVTLSFEKSGPLRLFAESDDLSMQCAAEVPREWFDKYSVHTDASITVEVMTVVNALVLCTKCRRTDETLQLSARSRRRSTIVLSYLNASSNALAISIPLPFSHGQLESQIFPRQVSSIPLDLGFHRYVVGASLKCPLFVIRDILSSFAAFQCEQVAITWKVDSASIHFHGIGSSHGNMSAGMVISAENLATLQKVDSFHFENMRFSLSSMMTILGGAQSGPAANAEPQDVPIEIQWNEAGMRVHIKWEHEEFPGVPASGDFVLLPFVM